MKLFRKISAAICVSFNDLYLEALLQGTREAMSYFAAACDHDAFVWAIQSAQFAHAGTNIFLRCNEKHFVIRFYHGGAFWCDWTVFPEYRGHSRINGWHVLPNHPDFLSDQRAAVKGLYGDQLNSTISKIQNLQ